MPFRLTEKTQTKDFTLFLQVFAKRNRDRNNRRILYFNRLYKDNPANLHIQLFYDVDRKTKALQI